MNDERNSSLFLDADTLYRRRAVFILMNRIDADIGQFIAKFAGQAVHFRIRMAKSFFHQAIDDGCKFIAGHHLVTLEQAIGISFEDTVASQFADVFVSPVVISYIGEEQALIGVDSQVVHPLELGDFSSLIFLADNQVKDFLGHGDTGVGNMVAAADFQADAGIDHVFTATEAAADAEHGVFIRPIVESDSCRIGTAVVTVTGCEIPLIVRVEVQRMERCQSGCASTDAVDAVIQLIQGIPQLGNVLPVFLNHLVGSVKLAAVHGIRRSGRHFSRCQSGNGQPFHIHALSIQDRTLFSDAHAFYPDILVQMDMEIRLNHTIFS